MQVLTQDEEHRFLNALDPVYPIDGSPYPSVVDYHVTKLQWRQTRNCCAAILMLDAGLRVGEVVWLNLFDCYVTTVPVKMLTIRKQITKGQKSRQIPVSPRLYAGLCRLMWAQPWSSTIGGVTRLIRSTRTNGQLTVRQLERVVRDAAWKSLERLIHPHALRHTFGTRLMAVTNIRVVQELLGHQNISSTQIYTHVNDIDKISAIEKKAASMPSL